MAQETQGQKQAETIAQLTPRGALSLASSLPAGITRHDAPQTSHDYVVANPMDQAAVDILFYDIACEARQGMEPGARLYIIVGEDHTSPIPRLSEAGLMENMTTAAHAGDTRHGSLLYAIEAPYNDLQFYARHAYRYQLDEGIQARLHEYDERGHHYAAAVLGQNLSLQTPESLATIFRTCLQGDIPLALIDAACEEGRPFISASDALACEVARNFGEGVDLKQENIPAISQSDNRGRAIRNIVMARRMVTAAKRHSACTIVSGIGAGHLNSGMISCLGKEIRPQDKILTVSFLPENSSDSPEKIIPVPEEDNTTAAVFRGTSGRSIYYSFVDSNDEETGFIRELGQSYKLRGDDIPGRFNELSAPRWGSARQALQKLISRAQAHSPEF